MNKLVSILKSKTEEELAVLMNNLGNEVTATQPMQKIDGSWVCFVYSDRLLENEKKPSQDYKKEPATAWMKNKLKSLGIAIPSNLTKGKYYELLKENGIRK